jgi:hypothetical protein
MISAAAHTLGRDRARGGHWIEHAFAFIARPARVVCIPLLAVVVRGVAWLGTAGGVERAARKRKGVVEDLSVAWESCTATLRPGMGAVNFGDGIRSREIGAIADCDFQVVLTARHAACNDISCSC